jgi:hypothetical protein
MEGRVVRPLRRECYITKSQQLLSTDVPGQLGQLPRGSHETTKNKEVIYLLKTYAVRNWLGSPFSMSVEDSGVRAIEVTVCEVRGATPFADPVPGVLGHVRKDVCANIPAA